MRGSCSYFLISWLALHLVGYWHMAFGGSQKEVLSEVMTAAFPRLCEKVWDCTPEGVLTSASGHFNQEASIVNISVDSSTYPFSIRRQMGNRFDKSITPGTLSTALGGLNKLETLLLKSVGLRGSIVDEVSQLDSLTTLGLSANFIDGTLPVALGKLSRLKKLNLQNNLFSGTIPTELGLLQDLEYLNVAHNPGMSGWIPSEVTSLPKLQSLQVQFGAFEGAIDTRIGNLTELRSLHLDVNKFEGSLPSQLGLLRHLNEMNLAMNTLQGTIPSTFGKLTGMLLFSIAKNPLQATLPTELGNWAKLKALNFRSDAAAHSGVRGTLPSEMARLTELRSFISEHSHELSGSIPTELGHWSKLTDILGSHCRFEGRLPTELLRLPVLEHLYLDVNRLTGTILEIVDTGRWTGLTYLWLGENSLTGSIAADLGKIPVERFDVQFNSLKGRIPISFSDATTKIDLTSNRLSGSIPSDIGKMPFIEEFRAKFNMLTGSIPSEFAPSRKLWIFDLHKNRLQGSITDVPFAKLRKLSTLDLARNYLTGTLPKFPNSVTFPMLSDNHFEGQMPIFTSRAFTIEVNGNKLTGSLPSDMGKLQFLRELNLATNLFKGSIPLWLGDMEFLSLLMMHSNLLTNSIPSQFGKLPVLEVLTLHGNRINGRVPSLHFTGGSLWNSGAVISLFGNRLSCELPNITWEEFDKAPQIILLLGNNFFQDPVPLWMRQHPVPDHDVILYVPRHDLFPLLGLTWSSFAILLASVYSVLRRHAWHFVQKEILKRRRETLLDKTHWSLIIVFSCMSVVGLGGLLLAFVFGEKFYTCGSELSKTSAAYFDSDAASSTCVIVCWAIHLGISFVYCQIVPVGAKRNVKRHVPFVKRYSRKFSKLLWILIALVLAAPTIGYAFMLTTPSDNIIAKALYPESNGEPGFLTKLFGKGFIWSFVIMKVGVPVLASLLEALVLEPFSVRYSTWAGVRPAWLLATGFTMNLWLVPGLVLGILHENCFGYWRKFWTKCYDDESSLDVTLDDRPILGAPDYCSPPSVAELARRSTCMRSVIQILAPFITRKLIYRHLVFQALWVQFWLFAKRNENGELRLWKYLLLDDPIMAQRQLAYINVWAVTAVLWGPLIPLLNPVLLIMLVSEFLVYKLGVEHFRVIEEGSAEMLPSREFLTISLGFTSVLFFMFSMEVNLPAGYSLVCFLPLLIGLRCMKKMCPKSSAKAVTGAPEVELAEFSVEAVGPADLEMLVSSLSVGNPIAASFDFRRLS